MAGMASEGNDMDDQKIRATTAEVYTRRARNYDFTANLYYLIGLREWRQRHLAVKDLRLKQGDTVVEIGCGTGLNFGLFQRHIGPAGRVIGVDLTPAMLEQASRRVARRGWKNVELVQSDAASYVFPENVTGVFSSYALSLMPDCGRVVDNAAQKLANGGHMVVLDLKVPDGTPRWLYKLALPLVRPFAVKTDFRLLRPWDTIRDALHRNFEIISEKSFYLGVIYIIQAQKE